MSPVRRLALIVACALFIENLDATAIATSLPVIAADLGTEPIALKLALTAYLLALAVFIPISGWVADRHGARPTFIAAIAVFLLGSVACAASTSLETMVAARFLQGAGGALMVPVSRLVLLRSVPKHELVEAIGWITIPALIAPMIGPPLGGAIATYGDWRWIFLINLPIGALGIVLARRYIPDLREPVEPLDWLGFALTGGGLALAMFGFSTLGRHLVSMPVAATSLVAGLAALAAYGWHAQRHPHPLIDLGLLRLQTFRAGVVGGSLFRIGMGAAPFLLPLMLQLGFGLTALQSGLLSFTSAIGAIAMKTAAGRILRRFGFRRVLWMNAVAASALMAAYGLFRAGTPHWMIIATLLVAGCSRSLHLTAISAITVAEVEGPRMGQATTLSGMAQQFSLALGVAIGGYALQLAGELTGRAPTDAANFAWAFLVVGVISAFSAWSLFRLPADAGHEMSGRAPAGPAADAAKTEPGRAS